LALLLQLQNYATSLFPGNLGNVSLAVLYISVCVFVSLSPAIVHRWGERLSMVIGAAGYVRVACTDACVLFVLDCVLNRRS
jgi:hypothetical protein